MRTCTAPVSSFQRASTSLCCLLRMGPRSTRGIADNTARAWGCETVAKSMGTFASFIQARWAMARRPGARRGPPPYTSDARPPSGRFVLNTAAGCHFVIVRIERPLFAAGRTLAKSRARGGRQLEIGDRRGPSPKDN